ncbi:MAG TPA: F0F1 ATP synthase subunit A [Acidimicrobiales bacterium]|nr:F0F1 ATP synthase subunit A [Acidimicrobiales bacterium]
MLFAAAKTIPVGDHPYWHLAGLTIDEDIVLGTLLAAAIFLGLGIWMRKKLTDGVPSKIQIVWEVLTEQVTELADSAIGPEGRRFVPVGVTLFLFILICNWLDFLPSALRPGQSGDIFPAPTSDVNLPLAMALFVIVWAHIESFRARGFRGYFRHYAQPFKALAPINVIEEITKPITLTFRLFGNIFSGGLMVVVMLTLLPIYVTPPLEIVWKFFDTGLLGTIQAFIFTLLTMLYFGFAMSHDESPEAHASPEPAAPARVAHEVLQ